MKLRSREICHNCAQYVIYVLDDVTETQVFYCPNCNHEHRRKLDEYTIIRLREFPPRVQKYAPKDILGLDAVGCGKVMGLHLAGYIPRPASVTDEVYYKCEQIWKDGADLEKLIAFFKEEEKRRGGQC